MTYMAQGLMGRHGPRFGGAEPRAMSDPSNRGPCKSHRHQQPLSKSIIQHILPLTLTLFLHPTSLSSCFGCSIIVQIPPHISYVYITIYIKISHVQFHAESELFLQKDFNKTVQFCYPIIEFFHEYKPTP